MDLFEPKSRTQSSNSVRLVTNRYLSESVKQLRSSSFNFPVLIYTGKPSVASAKETFKGIDRVVVSDDQEVAKSFGTLGTLPFEDVNVNNVGPSTPDANHTGSTTPKTQKASAHSSVTSPAVPQKQISSSDLKPVIGHFQLFSIYCTDLQPKDSSGLSDPYVKIVHDGKKTLTQKQVKTLNPKWFDVGYSLRNVYSSEKITITVWDYDRGPGKDDFEGQIEFTFDFVREKMTNGNNNQKVEEIFTLNARAGKNDHVKGTITLIMSWDNAT